MTATAGGVLAAVDAIREQETFTREQVAYLLALAYDSGRTAAYREDLAELHSVWEDHAERRRTYEDLVAERIAEMTPVDKTPYLGGPVEWDEDQPADQHLRLVR